MWLAKFSVRNPVLVNLIMVAVIVGGTLSLISLPRELMPDMSLNWVFITTSYPGVAPEEIEKLITIPIEDEVSDVDDIDLISSVSSEGLSFISINFEDMSDDEFDKRFQDVRQEMDKVTDLPEEAEDPALLDFGTADFIPLVAVVLSGNISEFEMKKIAEDMRDDLLDIENVGRVELSGIRDREIWVEADPNRLNAYNLALTQVISAIRNQNLNVPGGVIKMGRTEFIVRTIGEISNPEEIKDVIVRWGSGGNHVRVGDVARVIDTFEDAKTTSRKKKKKSVMISITKKGGGNSFRIVDEVENVLERYKNNRFPSGLGGVIFNDKPGE